MGNFQPWANPDTQSVAGLNSAMVYGENLQFAVGLNHQVALGSNLQLCINPSVLFELLGVPGSSTLSSLFGTGLGGNMQFTIGSSTSVFWGRQFEIDMGPEKITIDGNQHKAFSIVMCSLIGAACIAYAIAYGLCKDEDDRATIVLIFQVTIDLLLAAFMTQMMFYKGIEAGLTDGLRTLFGAGSSVPHSTTLEDFASALAFAGLMSAAIVPPVAIAVEEGHFQGETQSSS
jgi:hypothetical protein